MQIVKVKIPLESSKDTRDYVEGLDEVGNQASGGAQAAGADTAMQAASG